MYTGKNNSAERNKLYPVFLKLETLHTLLVGGGYVALEKLQSVLGNAPAAAITIVAPLIRNELREFIKGYVNINIIERKFEAVDLEEKNLVIVAIDDTEASKEIKRLAGEKKLLVNVADTPELCDFYLGSIVQKGNLKIAVSTNGKSPTIAKRIKETLNDTLPEEIDELLDNMQQIRDKLSGDFAQKVKELNELTKQLVTK
ncbi:MAG: bifunctional precorrin-2 dehydrogenase/sirohydrochlorin ferrochelatase [Sphingobacteriales bacterium]|nr:MAG: bifunctional precorrin-2 dehydrogenase/sirohydrochlorin ferrochelatase [Sphingobacteriales bacterium]